MDSLTIGTVIKPQNGEEKQYIVIEELPNIVRCISNDYLTKFNNATYCFNKNIIKVIRQLDKNEFEILKSKLKIHTVPSNLKTRR